MKITVNQLRRIIKEEVQRSLNESSPTMDDPALSASEKIEALLNAYLDNPSPEGYEEYLKARDEILGINVQDWKEERGISSLP